MKFEFSAGGVVYKETLDGIQILVAQHSQHHGWGFPKGRIGDTKRGESKEEAAIREVKEETGIEVTIIQPLSPETYWFVWEGEKVKKTVYYFIMEHAGGDTQKRDMEMEQVEWLPIQEVENRLTYPSDKKVWQEAKIVLEKMV